MREVSCSKTTQQKIFETAVQQALWFQFIGTLRFEFKQKSFLFPSIVISFAFLTIISHFQAKVSVNTIKYVLRRYFIAFAGCFLHLFLCFTGYEYTERGYNGGFDPMGGFNANNYDAAMGGSGGFMGEEKPGKGSDKKVFIYIFTVKEARVFIFCTICRHLVIDNH